jgi:hypothetical protein
VIVPIVLIVPHRSMWLVYGVFVGTVSTQTIVPHRPPTTRVRWGTMEGTVDAC